jgi:hypothetical protein
MAREDITDNKAQLQSFGTRAKAALFTSVCRMTLTLSLRPFFPCFIEPVRVVFSKIKIKFKSAFSEKSRLLVYTTFGLLALRIFFGI